jgi:riboflavin biosynthesis pyrimidine reductase
MALMQMLNDTRSSSSPCALTARASAWFILATVLVAGGASGCGFAGFLLDHELIDQLVIKLDPVIFGHGIRLFGGSARKVGLALSGSKVYASGVLLLRYDLEYGDAKRVSPVEVLKAGLDAPIHGAPATD